MEFQYLGALRVSVEGGPLPLGGPKQRVVLAHLLIRANTVVPVDQLIDATWDDEPPKAARNSLQSYISRLRGSLGPDRIESHGDGYVLRVDRDEVDGTRFEDLVTDGRDLLRQDPVAAASLLREGLALWGGRPFSDLDDTGSLRAEITRLEEMRWAATADRIASDLAMGRHRRVVGELEALTVEHPLRERLWGLLMLALYRAGRQSEALDAFTRAREGLAAVGLDPSPALRRLQEQVLAQDEALLRTNAQDLDVVGPRPAPVGGAGTGTVGEQPVDQVSTVEQVTCLFTDIEGSTRLWSRHPGTMGAVISRHHELLTASVGRTDGVVHRDTGDGIFAVFPTARAAVTAAVDAQRSIRAEDWQTVGPLLVRMGIHTGDVERRAGGYQGTAVNLTARIAEAAHGGQVLVSAATKALAVRGVPDAIGFVDLGEHRLKGLPRPERLFQVTTDDLPDSFPPLRAAGEPAGRLPTYHTTFVGRAAELLTVADMVAAHRLVTLTGVGGSGKTRLATELAREVGAMFVDGAYFVDLASLGDGARVPRHVASALGMEIGASRGPGGAETIEEQLLLHLGQRRLLLVLDNCEHVLAACADLVERMLGSCASVTVLATSREPLGVAAEHVAPVRPLDLPTDDDGDDSGSMRLLLDRARSVRPDLPLGDRERRALREICRRLDGLPLAIELAAARLAHMSPVELASRLDDRFRLLVGGRRHPERHRTLEATIDWSYGLLEPEEQTLLRRLAVFAGGATLEAIEAVATDRLDEHTSIDVLGALVDRSLVTLDTSGGRTRYRLLETIRLYAHEKLVVAGEIRAIERRHAAHYLAWLEDHPWDLRLISATVVRDIERELGDIRLALEHAHTEGRTDLLARLLVATVGLVYIRGHVAEFRRWYEIVDQATLSPELRAELSVHTGWVTAWSTIDAQELLATESRVREARDALASGHRARALAACVLAALHTTLSFGQPELLRRYGEEASSVSRRAGLPLLEAFGLAVRADGEMLARDYEAGLVTLETAAALPGLEPVHDGIGVRGALAVARHLCGDHEGARRAALQVVMEGQVWLFTVQLILGVVAAALGEWDRALAEIRAARRVAADAMWHVPLVDNSCLVALAALRVMRGDHARAGRLLAALDGGKLGYPPIRQLYRYYRDRVSDTLVADTARGPVGGTTSLDTLIAEELGIDDGEIASDRR